MTSVIRFPLLETAALTVDLRVRHTPPEFAARIDELWQQREQDRLLFDAPIVSLAQHGSETLAGELVDFRMWYACCKDPELRSTLDIHPLGVSGLTTHHGKVLVGKRSSALSSYPGAMECCPSGSVDASFVKKGGLVDVHDVLFAELAEETGIQHTSVRSAHIMGLYLSADTGVFDVVVAIELSSESPVSRSKEYDELLWISKDQLPSILQKDSWVPLSQMLLGEFLP